MAVEEHGEVDHVRGDRAAEDHLVEGDAPLDDLPLVDLLGPEAGAVLGMVLSVEYLKERLLEAVLREVGEEAEVAAVYANYRDVGERKEPRGADDAAVAADHHGEIADLGKLLHGHGAVTLELDGGSGIGLDIGIEPEALQVVIQSLYCVIVACDFLRLADYCYIVELHWLS